jgi:hypothetical protein
VAAVDCDAAQQPRPIWAPAPELRLPLALVPDLIVDPSTRRGDCRREAAGPPWLENCWNDVLLQRQGSECESNAWADIGRNSR